MGASRAWAAYPSTYRAAEISILANWIHREQSGAVVGLPGCGRSNLLGFLCHRPEALRSYLPVEAGPVVLIPVDLNNLPTHDLSTLYRVILRAFYTVRGRLDAPVQEAITRLYLENRAEQDPFLPQSALHELFQLFQSQQIRVVLVLNHFDRFCQEATPRMLNTLRGLRDSFKDTLCYIVGMSQEVTYFPDSAALGDMYVLLDRYICWVGPMVEADARQLIAQEMGTVPTPDPKIEKSAETAPKPLAEEEVQLLLALTGRFPALLKAACHWWLVVKEKPAFSAWVEILLADPTLQYRLDELWAGLTQEEQLVLSEVQKLQMRSVSFDDSEEQIQDGQERLVKAFEGLNKQSGSVLARLTDKGLCRQTETGWGIVGDLLAAYVAQVEGRGRGKIWLDQATTEFYQGQIPLDGLTPLEREVLDFLIKHPRERHSKSVLIDHAWPDEFVREGIADDSLFQVIKKLRQKIEPIPSKPCYIITWRGQPEGGYQFFPEGKPGH